MVIGIILSMKVSILFALSANVTGINYCRECEVDSKGSDV